ncbi:hypothetical protein E2C01_085862 [Portunus trituberculatus]|uniref:Uncharacterized protein n=1 Tax=Portunus trituberculatus TaxID=210409 RepID=A0A5B7J7U1_PORTR|nr:hypothetical protein [Portunus trituberculatus]
MLNTRPESNLQAEIRKLHRENAKGCRLNYSSEEWEAAAAEGAGPGAPLSEL